MIRLRPYQIEALNSIFANMNFTQKQRDEAMSVNPPIWTCGNCTVCGSRWHLPGSCPVAKPLTFVPLYLNPEGEALGPYPNSDMKPTRIIGSCFAVHFICSGFVDLKPVSMTHNAIVCRTCHLRVLIPNTIETWGDLRTHFRIHVLANMFIPPTPHLFDKSNPSDAQIEKWSEKEGEMHQEHARARNYGGDENTVKDGFVHPDGCKCDLCTCTQGEHPISGGEHDVVKDAIAEHMGITDFDGDKRGFWNEEGDVH